MNALLRAKHQWELVNIKRLEKLIEAVAAVFSLVTFLVVKTFEFLVAALLLSEIRQQQSLNDQNQSLLNARYEEIEILNRFR